MPLRIRHIYLCAGCIEKNGIEVKERIIRAEIDGGEICNGREIRGWIGLGGKTNEESLWLIYCKTPKNLQ